MYGALLGMIFFLPFSFALIEICQVTMISAWALKCFLLGKAPQRPESCPRGFNFFSSNMGWALMAIALLIVLTIPFSHFPSLSLKKFFTRFLQQILLMYLVTVIVQTPKRLYGVLSVLLFTLFLVSVDVIIQFTWGKSIAHHTPLIYGRVTGPMNHPNDLGTMLVTVLPVVMVSIITFRRWLPLQTAILILFLLLVNALGLTASRGAWIAFAVSMIVLVFTLKRPKVILLVALLLLAFGGVYGRYSLSSREDLLGFSERQAHVIKPNSAWELFFGPTGRETYWQTAGDVIKHNPWFGCGYNAYVQTLKDLRVGHEEYPHNSLLHITAELGLMGLILWGWFFTALCLQIKNALRAVSRDGDLFLLGCGISAGILAWFIHSLMDTAWASLQLGVLWWLFIGILLSLGPLEDSVRRKLQ